MQPITLVVNHPTLFKEKILGLPSLIRTLKTLERSPEVKDIYLTGEYAAQALAFILQSLPHFKERLVLSDEPKCLVMDASFHYDPDFINHNLRYFGTSSDNSIPENWYQDLKQPGAFKEAEKKLFITIRKKTLGLIAPTLNKPVSFFITRFLVKTPITPNQITFLNMVMASIAAYLLTLPDYSLRLLAGFLGQMSSVIDGCDGEVARLKVQYSTFGGWLDTVSDDYVNNVLFLGLFWGLFRDTGLLFYWYGGWTILIISLAVSSLIYIQLFKAKSGPNVGQLKMGWKATEEKSFYEKYIHPLGKRDFFIFLIFILLIFNLRIPLFYLMGVGAIGAFMAHGVSIFSGLKNKRNP
ncbi:CDP-alcohol phosphatidyltransferase family protein [bacterium]|nr:CDP-alcohol phosphatidyltransferase family protein [bacterium]